MRILTLILIGALVMAIPSVASAVVLTVKATVTSGTSLASDAYYVLKCPGSLFKPSSPPLDPWSGVCAKSGTTPNLDFGTLTTRLYNADGTDAGGAGCFYAKDFFMVYLYPDAWGGKGYELKQLATTFPTAIQNAVLLTPVYRPEDGYDINKDGDITDPGEGPQGALSATYGEVLGDQVLAKNGGLILKSKRGRIVRADYGIPPSDSTVTRPIGWAPIDLTTTAPGIYSVSVTITITEWL